MIKPILIFFAALFIGSLCFSRIIGLIRIKQEKYQIAVGCHVLIILVFLLIAEFVSDVIIYALIGVVTSFFLALTESKKADPPRKEEEDDGEEKAE